LKNYRIYKFQIKLRKRRIELKKPTKAPLRVLSELNYRKAAYLKIPEKKQGRLVWLLTFSKTKALSMCLVWLWL
jgi:hypothetical protein